jgi:hypothetical protein
MADTSPKKKVAAKPKKPAAHPKYSEISAAGFFAAVFIGVLAFLGLAAFGFTAFFGLAAGLLH